MHQQIINCLILPKNLTIRSCIFLTVISYIFLFVYLFMFSLIFEKPLRYLNVHSKAKQSEVCEPLRYLSVHSGWNCGCIKPNRSLWAVKIWGWGCMCTRSALMWNCSLYNDSFFNISVKLMLKFLNILNWGFPGTGW